MIDGIHMHTLCEQDFEPLRRTWDKAFDYLEPFFGQFKWINLGVATTSPGPTISATNWWNS